MQIDHYNCKCKENNDCKNKDGKKLLNPIETIPYDVPVGIVYQSGNIITDFIYDISFEDWMVIKTLTFKESSLTDKPRYWFHLKDVYNSFVIMEIKKCKEGN